LNVAVDVVEFYAAPGCERVALMKFFGIGATMIGGVGPEGKNEKCDDGSENSARPCRDLAIAVHKIPPVQANRRADLQSVRSKPEKAHRPKKLLAPVLVYESYLSDVPLFSLLERQSHQRLKRGGFVVRVYKETSSARA
jgi:hypothetical protein